MQMNPTTTTRTHISNSGPGSTPNKSGVCME
jgi:hypothetical protein